MTCKKETAAQVHHHPDGEGQQITLDGVLLPEPNSIAEKPTVQGPIAALLPVGSGRAVSLQRLAKLTGLSTREVRRAIQRERLQGIPICADNLNGYYLAADAAERERFVRSMRHRARQIIRVARAVENGGDVNGPKEQIKARHTPLL